MQTLYRTNDGILWHDKDEAQRWEDQRQLREDLARWLLRRVRPIIPQDQVVPENWAEALAQELLAINPLGEAITAYLGELPEPPAGGDRQHPPGLSGE